MTTDPVVSILILTYNNPPILRQCIESALALQYPALEVIVVDNASTDNTVEMVRANFPEVTLVGQEVNSPCAARNAGYQAASGDFVFSLDNDMILPDTDVIHRAVALFDEFPDVCVLASKITSLDNPNESHPSHWWHVTPIDQQDQFFLTSYFPEGAVFFRADALAEAGGYDERFFHVAENLDLAMRFLAKDWRFLYCPNLVAIELVVSGPLAQRRSMSNEYSMRNRLWLAWKHFPIPRALAWSVPRIVRSAGLALRHRWFDYYLTGLLTFYLPPADIRSEREPMPRKKQIAVRAMEGTIVKPKSVEQ